jgi:hypothetical protein
MSIPPESASAEPPLMVSDAQTARFFSQFGALVYLRPFLARECTSVAAAEQLNISRQRMNYWVNKMLHAKLLRVVRHQEQGGHRTPVYRTVHDRMELPLSALPHATVEGLMDFLVGQWWWDRLKRAFTSAWDAGLARGSVRIYREGDKGTIEPLPRTSAVDDAIHNHWRVMTLKPAQVAQFRQELEAMIDRYDALSDVQAAETVLVHAAVIRESLNKTSRRTTA